MKTVITLLVVALIIHGSWRAGTSYWRYFQFKDAVQAAALFSASKSDADLRGQVVAIAERLQIPLAPDTIAIRRDEAHIYVDTAYMDQIQLVPTKFYPWQFNLHAEALVANVPR